MTLLDLLDLDGSCLPIDTRSAAFRVSTWWVECGRSVDRVGLSCFLDSSLKRCCKEGMRYPKIFLLRLKQLQRGEWSPDRQE
jgi:hypothetical protein